MARLSEPIRPKQLTIVPANEASWDDLVAIFGSSDYPGQCQMPEVQGRRLDLARLHAGGADGEAPGAGRLRQP